MLQELSEPDLSAVASACSSLRRLTLTAATLNSTALLPLATLSHLRFLHLDNVDLRPQGGLRALASLRALVSITLTHLKPFNLGVAQWVREGNAGRDTGELRGLKHTHGAPRLIC